VKRSPSAIKQPAEEAMGAKFDYIAYIESTPREVWHALTDADVTATYWGHSNVSDWGKGSAWEHRRVDGSGVADVVGEVVQSDPPRKLVITWADPALPNAISRVVFDIEPVGAIVKLTLTHEDLPDEASRRAAASGWSAVLSNLKSLLETGIPLSVQPWNQRSES
jgi:uncharacterized protein YndB with AHSA1/START domain